MHTGSTKTSDDVQKELDDLAAEMFVSSRLCDTVQTILIFLYAAVLQSGTEQQYELIATTGTVFFERKRTSFIHYNSAKASSKVRYVTVLFLKPR